MQSANRRGHAVVLEFMDPHCTDVCPLVSAEFIDAYHDLGGAAGQWRGHRGDRDGGQDPAGEAGPAVHPVEPAQAAACLACCPGRWPSGGSGCGRSCVPAASASSGPGLGRNPLTGPGRQLDRIEYVTSHYPDRCFSCGQFGPRGRQRHVAGPLPSRLGPATSSLSSCPSCSSWPRVSPRFPTRQVNEMLTRRQRIIDRHQLSTTL